jgi:flagellar hook assembly protein FlgD
MYSDGGELWYLSNNGNGTQLMESVIECYIQSSPLTTNEVVINVLDAKGLYVDSEGVFTTYENNSNTLIGFTIDATHVTGNNVNDMLSNYQLEQNYPNPFNMQTNINFILNKPGSIDLKIYNIRGEVIKTLLDNKKFNLGRYSINWNGTNDLGAEVTSGIYVYKLVIDNNKYIAQSMILSK